MLNLDVRTSAHHLAIRLGWPKTVCHASVTKVTESRTNSEADTTSSDTHLRKHPTWRDMQRRSIDNRSNCPHISSVS